jgi:hypothetical protein
VDDDRPSELPGERRPERQLDRPPSERYREAQPVPTEATRPAGRFGVGGAFLAALAGAVAIALGGGLVTITAGLLVIAAVLGWIVAVLVSLSAEGPAGRTRRRSIAAVIAVGGVVLGQLGLWLIAREEGGTLGILDYLAEVFGVLVPLEFVFAGGVAWWRTA